MLQITKKKGAPLRRCKLGDSGLSRREFLLTCGSVFVAMSLAAWDLSGCAAEEETPLIKGQAVVRGAFLRPRGPYWMAWPGGSYDMEGHERDYTNQLRATEKQLGMRIILPEQPLYDENDVNKFISEVEEQPPDGLLLILMHMYKWGDVIRISELGIPTVIFAPIGVSFIGHVAELSRKPGIYLVSSLDFDAVKYGLKMIRAARQMRESRIVMAWGNEERETVVDKLGTRVRYIPRERWVEELNRVAETREVRAIADYYSQNAKKIREPSRADIINAAKTYITARRILKAEKADAISMDCLGLIRERRIPCPPCLAWSKLLDEGTTGACECDLNATLTHMLVLYLFDKPGFEQDPVADTVHNLFIGAHCTCATRLNGIDKPPEPFILRSHSESNIGVSMQVLWRKGQRITIAQFDGPQKMLIYSGTVVGNVDTPPAGGCRTSVEVAIDTVPDVRDVQGFHQLLIYGDHARQLRAFCQLFGITAAPA